MRRSVKALMAVGAIVVASGCTANVSGLPNPSALPVAGSPSYVDALDNEDRTFVAQMAGLRMLDLCGYFDIKTLSKLGPVEQPDATRASSGCVVGVNAKAPGQLIELDTDLVPSVLRGKWDAKPIDLDGNAVYERSRQEPRFENLESYSTCDHFVPFAAGYDLRISIFKHGEVPLCDTLRSITRASLKHFSDKPLRGKSEFHAFHAATVSDPCLAAAALADGEDFDIDVENSGFDRCRFHIAGRPWTTVQLGYTLKGAGGYPDDAKFAVDGMAATRLTLNDFCEITIDTGDPRDGRHYDRVVGLDSTEMVSTVIARAKTCDGAEKAAHAGAKVFLEGI
ncbi:hypothetical protein [Smaragdicoccus niigatensis]|uniref:hypothetical protein n=1 Tax=Smaragdicoccus niigatensis TaxID=359359 RepID=UPI0003764020|nr:hypothetical protein [Smaragdicoccus niigatensis]